MLLFIIMDVVEDNVIDLLDLNKLLKDWNVQDNSDDTESKFFNLSQVKKYWGLKMPNLKKPDLRFIINGRNNKNSTYDNEKKALNFI